MLIDRSHRGWMVGVILCALVSSGVYVWYAATWPNGPTGGSVPGMVFGAAAAALMMFCGLLTLRKKFPGWSSLGTAQTWLRAHIWLGLLSAPLVFFHSGFRWGGWLELALMGVYAVVMASGLFGLIMQQYVPHLLRTSVTREAMFDQVPNVCDRLRATADELVEKQFGSLVSFYATAGQRETNSKQELVDFYLAKVRPFLEHDQRNNTYLSSEARSAEIAGHLRRTLPDPLHGLLDRLFELVAERRELALQEIWHARLHGWLVFHMAFSVSLLALGSLHVVMSLYY